MIAVAEHPEVDVVMAALLVLAGLFTDIGWRSKRETRPAGLIKEALVMSGDIYDAGCILKLTAYML
ncbi:hypothetical protein [Staphylococcus aureus]|uniref:hypothetical protein n=1 Tax=Staphylococcus aureus TaxID=1280 RepID=UPI001C531648